MHLKDTVQPGVVRAQWRVQRVSWVVFALFLAAALLGAFGQGGVLAKREVTSSGDGVDVRWEYPRFARWKASDEAVLAVTAPEAKGERLVVAFDGPFEEAVSFQTINPPPDATEVGPDGAVYTWRVADWSQPLTLSFDHRPEHWGSYPGELTVRAGDAPERRLSFEQIVYP